MTGQNQIIAARKQGYKPAAVFVMAGLEPCVSTRFDEPENALRFGLYPTVYIPVAELASRLDLRFLAGLRVHVHADAFTDEVLRLVDAIHSAGAAYLIAGSLQDGEILEYRDGEVNAWTS